MDDYDASPLAITIIGLSFLLFLIMGFAYQSCFFLWLAIFAFGFGVLVWPFIEPRLHERARKRRREREINIRQGLITYQCINEHIVSPDSKYKFCPECGEKLFFKDRTVEKKTMVRCAKGHRFEESWGHRFCPKCGNPLEKEQRFES
ncbi:MAG TPA: zinc ribbon domain-containing protein [Acidobacteriota bacterium]|nr:zinc ribbon domain-containing protein [Acidobacteriota bacterium]